MKIVFLTGAYKNAGDFLIEKRAIELLRYVYPNIEIIKILRINIKENIDLINSSDVVVLGGGPIYMENMDKFLPVEFCCDYIQPPIMILGGGWWGINGCNSAAYDYKFTNTTVSFLRKVDIYGLGLGCRDLYSYKTLKKQGFRNVYMTGCPAWYDLKYVHNTELSKRKKKIKKIIISDPAQRRNFESAFKIVEYVYNKFPNSSITFMFHRGIGKDQYTSERQGEALESLCEKLKSSIIPMNVIDISYGAAGFDIYNDCDLHIGFRVHAHIYNLSRRNRTILIEEDGRGAGVNQALGLPSITSYNDKYSGILERLFSENECHSKQYMSPYIIEEIDNYLSILKATDDQYFLNAFKLQEKYFDTMISHIKKIKG